jgi:hypothetical protein
MALDGGLVPDPDGIIRAAPGEQAQVADGEGPMGQDPTNGKCLGPPI